MIKKKCKNFYYSKNLRKLQENAKQTWKVMNEIKGKAKLMHCSNLFSKITVNEIAFFDKLKIAKEFNVFANAGLELTGIIPTGKSTFESSAETVN